MKKMHSRFRQRPHLHGFTLVELLTVIVVLGVLAAIFIPVVGKVRATAGGAKCLSNLHQIGTAMHMHAAEYRGVFPRQYGLQITDPTLGNQSWSTTLGRYLTDHNGVQFNNSPSGSTAINFIFTCPSGDPEREAAAVSTSDVPGGYGVFYSGWPSTKTRVINLTKSDGSTLGATFPDSRLITNPSRTILAMDFPQTGTFASGQLTNILDAISYRHGGSLNVLWASGTVSSLDNAEILASRASTSPLRNDYWYAGN